VGRLTAGVVTRIFAASFVRGSHLAALLVMNVFWAATYSAFKALSGHLSVGEIVTLRYGMAALVLAVLWRWLPGRAPWGVGDLTRAAVMGLLVFAVGPRLQVWGVRLGNAGDSAVVVALEPIVTVVAAALFLRERVPGWRWVGFGMGMGGIVLLNGAWNLSMQGAALWANLVFISSFVCESAYSVVGKPLLERSSPLKVIAVALFFGAGLNLILDGPSAVARVPGLSLVDWAWLGFLIVICTLVGYTLWYVVIRECDVNVAAMTILVQPVLGALIAAWLVGDRLHWGQLWGTLAILAGLVVGLVVGNGSAAHAPMVVDGVTVQEARPRSDDPRGGRIA